MFEIAEPVGSLSPSAYEAEEKELRTALLKAQTALGGADFPVLVLLHGALPSAARAVFNVLHEWLDARYLTTEAWERPTEDERERPEYWRYWRWLPPKRRIGVFLGSWYTKPLWSRVRRKIDRKTFRAALDRANAFEKLLADDGALIIKVWLHAEKELEAEQLAHEVLTKRHTWSRKHDRRALRHYDEFARVGAQTIERTSTNGAPWTTIDSADFRARNVAVARLVANAIHRRLAAVQPSRPPSQSGSIAVKSATPLDSLNLDKKLVPAEYERRLGQAQRELAELAFEAEKKRRRVVIVFEGSDAAGKGGAIRRLTVALDARQYRVTPISAPTEDERAYHYLWRFWRRVPKRGRFTVYDRSWYGRVLVERVEGLASEEEYRRAYAEINDFEKQLVEAHGVVIKFWLQISLAEQARRFESRKLEPWKNYKLTDEDYRNRAKSTEYEIAANDMLARTDTTLAPWTLVEAENKDFARVKVVETVCALLRKGLSE